MAALLLLGLAPTGSAAGQPAASPTAQPGLVLPAGYASRLVPPLGRTAFPYRSAFGSLCSLGPLACALIDRPFAFNARLELFLHFKAPDGSTGFLLPFVASVPLFGRAEVGIGSCYMGAWNANPNPDKAPAGPQVQGPSALCPLWLAGKLLLFPWFRDPHTHPALSAEYQGEYQAGPFGGLNQLGLPGPASKVSLSYRHPRGALELSGAVSVLVDHLTRAGTVQFGGHLGYRLLTGEHYWLFAQALAQLPSFGPVIHGDQPGQLISLIPPVAGTVVVGAQQRADFGFGVGLSLMLTRSELETRLDVLFRLLSFELGPHIRPLIPASAKRDEPPKVAVKLARPSALPGSCPARLLPTADCDSIPVPKTAHERLPGSACYLYSEDGSEQLEMGHVDSTGRFCDWDGLHLPLGAILPPEVPVERSRTRQAVPRQGLPPGALGPLVTNRDAGRQRPEPRVIWPAATLPAAAAASALSSAVDVSVPLLPRILPPIWRHGRSPVELGFADGALEAREHVEQIYAAMKEHGPLVVLPRPQDIADWWQETKQECLDRLSPCIQEKAEAARTELNRIRRLSWEQKQYELGKLSFQLVEQAAINAMLPGGGLAMRTGGKAAESAVEKQLVKAAERKFKKEAEAHAGEAAVRTAADASTAEVKRVAEAEAKRTAEAKAAGSGGRGANHLKPDPEAQGPHSTFKTNAESQVTGHAEWEPNPRNPSGMDQVKRVDTQYANPHTHHNNATSEQVLTPHVHEKSTSGSVRPARPDELPR